VTAPADGGALWWSPVEEKRPVRLATHRGFLKNRERGERVIGAGKSTKNSHGCTVYRGGKGLNPRGSRLQGGEDVYRTPKGVGVFLFGCSEGVGWW
jgi:hypothetical protein